MKIYFFLVFCCDCVGVCLFLSQFLRIVLISVICLISIDCMKIPPPLGPPLGHQSLSRTSQGKQAAKSRIACVFDWCSLGWGLHCCSQVVHICQPYCAKLGTLDAESVGIYAMSRASGSSLVRSLNPFNDIWGRRWCNFLQNQMCIILADRVIIQKYHFHAWISF